MAKVFVVQQPMRTVTQTDINRGFYDDHMLGKSVPAFDITPALKYGDMELLLDRGTIVGIATTPMVRSFREKLRDYSDEDSILPTGDPVAMGIAIAVAAVQNNGKVSVLRWDRKQKAYIRLTVEI